MTKILPTIFRKLSIIDVTQWKTHFNLHNQPNSAKGSSSIWYIRKIFRKTNISYPLIRTHTCTYPGVRNVSFLVYFCIRNKWMIPNQIIHAYTYAFHFCNCWNWVVGKCLTNNRIFNNWENGGDFTFKHYF